MPQEIDRLLAETDPLKALPRRLRETVDAIRNFDNFAAHPNEDKATLEIIDVDAGSRPAGMSVGRRPV
ncbi:hypothetical protein [Bradyrhizobium sp. LLZ17]|uniref:hypothetical protein n=1 Tax=Bradyrhizobium sp. LLZ17 TaxID=3239388 RepID=UPI0035103812